MINLSTLHVSPTMSFLAGPNKAAINALLLSRSPMRGVFNASVGHSLFIGFGLQPQPLLMSPPLFHGGSPFIPSLPLHSVFPPTTGF
jgi:hypothetical protein